jgi:hypothetical protein
MTGCGTAGTVRDVITGGTTAKLREWVRRYLPCEIAGTVGELGGAAIVYLVTESLGAAAIAATIGASTGYYAVAFLSALRWAYRSHGHRPWLSRAVVSNLIALRSVAVEFGPAELIDSVAVRPAAFYVGPLMFDNTVLGWILGKLVSDVAFYLCAIVSYERFAHLLVRRPSGIGEVTHESGPAFEAA